MLIPFPAELFAAALLTDIFYWRSADPLWTTMSSWLLLAGLVVGAVAVLAELIGLRGDRRPAWIAVGGRWLAFLLSVANFVFHVRDGYSAVVPAGPLLSAAVVLILLSTGWVGRRPARSPLAAAQGAATDRKGT
ncbi:MAG TPA: DUF2231 domain-containing protein [Caulobacteraceae bacterium]|jgi:uncharacterized membrane protein|nr:DUF2231 domain-containing protein [Caulobacteraceae bacterium]